MSRHQEVSALIKKLTDEGLSHEKAPGLYKHYLLPDHDVSAHRKAKAWPGKEYILMGNSFNLEPESCADRRSVSLSNLFARSPQLSIADALVIDEFNQILSRFEHDWLSRLEDSTVIGPAFDIGGRLIPDAFAVWRPVRTVLRAKQLVNV